MILSLAIASIVLAALPTLMFLANLPLFRLDRVTDGLAEGDAADDDSIGDAAVSILIPARDEADGIEACVRSCLASIGVELEVIVLDDHSEDDTAAIVQSVAESDPRVRLLKGQSLPSGWNGKQHACKQLAESARFDLMMFLDADVRLDPTAVARLVRHRRGSNVELLSAFPMQETGTWLECWLIPMMHYILLGFLPFSRMRERRDPSLAAGCGQLFLTTREAYRSAGTHEVIRGSRHDGLKLPRAYRAAGLMTDVVDGSALARCRMYRGASQVVRGLLKNATEGIANPKLIGVFTVLLLGASLLPAVALGCSLATRNTAAVIVAGLAIVIAHLPRVIAAAQLRQSMFGAACHVPATITFVVLQWIALLNHVRGKQVAWRGRSDS
ncbi:MAG: glycosyltransferase family 2 protein [Planctomycetota bacterium]